MAVQAQNPSPAFFFNRTNDQEGKNTTLMDYCTTQDQASGRKRGREQFAASLHHQTQVSTGLHLSFQQEQNPRVGGPGSWLSSSFLPVELAAQMKLQSEEIDVFLQVQGERLRRGIAEWRLGHYRALAERWAAIQLGEKEEELERAARRRAELEERAARLAAEAAAWRERARAEEAAAAELQARLRQAAEEEAAAGAPVEDAASACECGGGGREVPKCRACGMAAAGVVALPCRHLCLCAACDTAAAACPVCCCVKSASVEVYLT